MLLAHLDAVGEVAHAAARLATGDPDDRREVQVRVGAEDDRALERATEVLVGAPAHRSST